MRAAVRHGVARAALRVLRHRSSARDALMRTAAHRGLCVVLCYHRIAPDTGGDRAIDAVPPDTFADQLRALQEVGDIVALSRILQLPARYDRPAFAITLDDDDRSHVQYALPILRDLQIPATFFLSGRHLHGLGPYWWTLIEQSAAEIGLAATCQLLGHHASTIRELTRACRTAGTAVNLVTRETPPLMEPRDIRTLADAGMTIGFHTLRHLSLPDLDDHALAAALTEGLPALESAAGTRVELLAYPYGRADARVAQAARRAGYRAAFVTAERAVGPVDDPFLLGRLQPGAATPDVLLANAALRLAARAFRTSV
jgi:peptidoglycan/xylan/chitin deacetylase (PgdA/CDA1 family)